MFKEFIHWLTYPACTCGERTTCTKKLSIVGSSGVATIKGELLKCGKIKPQIEALKKVKLGKKK